MKVSYRNGIYKLEKRDFILDELVIKLDMCERRKEILFEWASSQIDTINENKLTSIVGAFFVYKIVPTSIGAEISVTCPFTNKTLDLSLIDDEAW